MPRHSGAPERCGPRSACTGAGTSPARCRAPGGTARSPARGGGYRRSRTCCWRRSAWDSVLRPALLIRAHADARQWTQREQPAQPAEQELLDALTYQPWIRERGLGLEAARQVVQAPLDEVLAVVREQAITLLAEPRARAAHDFRGVEAHLGRRHQEDRAAFGKGVERHFLDRLADDVVHECAVMNHAPRTDVDTVMRETQPRHDEMGTHRRLFAGLQGTNAATLGADPEVVGFFH